MSASLLQRVPASAASIGPAMQSFGARTPVQQVVSSVNETASPKREFMEPRFGSDFSQVPVRAAPQAVLQRKVEMRDVRGERSGFARLPELIDRLNAMSGGLAYSMDGRNLRYQARNEAALTHFDHEMMGFIDQEAVIPMRLTNRQASFKDRKTGQDFGVVVDNWFAGYVDIDDLLVNSDLALQIALVHVLRERTETRDYAGRMGSRDLRDAHEGPEFEQAHEAAVGSELELLRDYFSDPSIRMESGPKGDVQRVYRNNRGDLFRMLQPDSPEGLDQLSIEVLVGGRVKRTPEEYLRLRQEDGP